jgi:ADP-dependent phosphofructokinase/glucokinase
MDEAYWTGQYGQVKTPHLNPAVVGFNVNIDRIIAVSRTLLDSPGFRSAGLADLRSRLMQSMEHCTAEEWFVADPARYARFMDFFSGTGSHVMGGQAGIAALHLARLGAPEVFCLAPSIGPEALQILEKNGVQVPGHHPGAVAGSDTIHLIFEYQPGLVPLAAGAVPRNNRFIVSPEKTAENTLFTDRSLATVLPQISGCNRAFLSGYQYLHDESEFRKAADQIRAIRSCNPQMRVHIECVSVTDKTVLTGLVNHILPAADSAGMNEHELSLLLGRTEKDSPAGLVQGMLDLAERTGISRIHLHTYGFYLLVIGKEHAVPEASLASLLYAARVVAAAAGDSGTTISQRGIDAVRQIDGAYGAGPVPGIFSAGHYRVLAVPTLIAADITRTTGLGDILSSTAFVADIL